MPQATRRLLKRKGEEMEGTERACWTLKHDLSATLNTTLTSFSHHNQKWKYSPFWYFLKPEKKPEQNDTNILCNKCSKNIKRLKSLTKTSLRSSSKREALCSSYGLCLTLVHKDLSKCHWSTVTFLSKKINKKEHQTQLETVCSFYTVYYIFIIFHFLYVTKEMQWFSCLKHI